MKALIVVDIQVDFCEGGALGVTGGNAVADAVAELIASDHGYDHIVATRDHHIDPGDHFSNNPDFVSSWPPHCVVGTPGQSLHPSLVDAGFDAVFDKGSHAAAYSGFEGDADGVSLSDWLRDRSVTTVDICGIATDYCVRATVMDAVREGFEVTVLADLTAAVHPDGTQRVLSELSEAGAAIV